MALTSGQRDGVARAFHRLLANEPCAVVKSVVRAAVDDVDGWADAAATAVPPTSFNASLNVTFRNNATASQKATMLALVCWARAGRPLPEAA